MTTSSSADYHYDLEEIADAIWNLGLRHLRGGGVEGGKEMLNESARLGSPDRKRLLAAKYENGSDGLPRDPLFAAFWELEAEYQELGADRFFEQYRVASQSV